MRIENVHISYLLMCWSKYLTHSYKGNEYGDGTRLWFHVVKHSMIGVVMSNDITSYV